MTAAWTDPDKWRHLQDDPQRFFRPKTPPIPTSIPCPTCHQNSVRIDNRSPKGVAFVLWCEFCRQYWPCHRPVHLPYDDQPQPELFDGTYR